LCCLSPAPDYYSLHHQLHIAIFASIMLHIQLFKSFSKSSCRSQLAFLKDHRAYSSRSGSDSEAADLDAAREWFRKFNKSTIPEKLGKTEFVKSSGPGGQKVNKCVGGEVHNLAIVY